MQAYFVVTGVIFGLIALAHLFRLLGETRAGSDPAFLLANLAIAALGAVLAVWAAGLLLGIRCIIPAADFVTKLRENGLLTLTAGENVLRILPPLIVTEREIEEAEAVSKEVGRQKQVLEVESDAEPRVTLLEEEIVVPAQTTASRFRMAALAGFGGLAAILFGVDLLEFRARHHAQHFARQMPDRPIAGRRHQQFARIGLGIGDELGRSLLGRRRMDDHDARVVDEACHRRDVTNEVEGEVLVQGGVDRARHAAEQQRVAIGRRPHDRLRRDVS